MARYRVTRLFMRDGEKNSLPMFGQFLSRQKIMKIVDKNRIENVTKAINWTKSDSIGHIY